VDLLRAKPLLIFLLTIEIAWLGYLGWQAVHLFL
jgi:hypothetical protein